MIDTKAHPGAPAGTPLGGMAVAVDVAGIEKELASLWRTQSQDESKALTRACAWNLIVYTTDDEASARAKQFADKLVSSVPTRTILVKNQPYASTGKPIEAWVSANCHVGAGGGKLLCTEEIHIESRGKGAEHVPGLLRALVVPDVPTALWWAGAPPDNAAAVRLLLSGVDRLIVDTGAAPEGGLSRLAHVGGLLDGVTLVDLNWLRTASVRSLLASLFDPPGGHQPLWNIARVKLSTSSMSAARLMLGWLTSRLKWTVQERIPRSSGASWRLLSREEEPINVDVEILQQAVRASGLDRLVLETTSGVRYGFAATEGFVVQVEGPGALARTFSAAEPPDEQLLVAALGTRGRDRLYGVALHRALELDR
jgi:glucose-6-phosphate dehydrogenase assembly protein OpcA